MTRSAVGLPEDLSGGVQISGICRSEGLAPRGLG